MKDKEVITNAMRILRQAGVPFSTASYTVDEDDLSGVHAAAEMGVEPERVFKTIVTHGEKTGYNVFVIPCAEELDLKKCAAACGDKRVELIHVKELFGLTGYVRGGCSPVGMKKRFPTFLDETAVLWDEIYVSAGQRGLQLVIDPNLLAQSVGASFADLIR